MVYFNVPGMDVQPEFLENVNCMIVNVQIVFYNILCLEQMRKERRLV